MKSKQKGGKQDPQEKPGAGPAHEQKMQQRARHWELEQAEGAES